MPHTLGAFRPAEVESIANRLALSRILQWVIPVALIGAARSVAQDLDKLLRLTGGFNKRLRLSPLAALLVNRY
ncbi:hypothetical protein RPPX_19755 [Pseudomonas putida S12]|jgi:hypothetical protein|uniref:Uncharacterized protein n=1 Tax=Pseudomonas putida S12 TaxID=1215087 RepID=A0AA34RY14_PSEPU|nr:hypothetical protein RPPX_19755 [Pseudomonas putida S12]PTV57993.1 hypothetical protein DBL05_15350 [Pseudomonas putida]RIZ40158.1 hypothetical protein CIK02_11000 [Pseudomonas putida]